MHFVECHCSHPPLPGLHGDLKPGIRPCPSAVWICVGGREDGEEGEAGGIRCLLQIVCERHLALQASQYPLHPVLQVPF